MSSNKLVVFQSDWQRCMGWFNFPFVSSMHFFCAIFKKKRFCAAVVWSTRYISQCMKKRNTLLEQQLNPWVTFLLLHLALAWHHKMLFQHLLFWEILVFQPAVHLVCLSIICCLWKSWPQVLKGVWRFVFCCFVWKHNR